MIDAKVFDFDAIVVGSGISGGWAAKELTAIAVERKTVKLNAPFETPGFTLEIPRNETVPMVRWGGETKRLEEVKLRKQMVAGTWMRAGGERTQVCFDLAKGETTIT